MAVTSFGVTAADVLERVPFDTTQVSATSRPISTGDIETYIQDGSSSFVAVLTRAGLDPDSLNDDTMRQVRDAVEAYAVAECLDVIGISSQTMRNARQKYDDLLERYSSKPSMLSTTNKNRVRTNISTASTKRSAEFIDPNYDF